MTKEQWQAIINCDSSCDGTFVYALRSTGKYCRPSCRKKSYHIRRTIIFSTPAEAEAAGFQPCSRCRPDLNRWEGVKTELVRSAEALVQEHYMEKFSLKALSDSLHVDKSYLLRTFHERTGMTLLEYHNRIRIRAAQELLTHPEIPVSSVAASTGFISASHFSQVFRRHTGQTPSQYREDYLRSLEK